MKRLYLIFWVLSCSFIACSSTEKTEDDHADQVREEMRAQDEAEAEELLDGLLDSLAADTDSLLNDLDAERAEEQLIKSIDNELEER